MTGETSAGERLWRGVEVDRTANLVASEVAAQVTAALAGPIGTTLAALQFSALPRAFIAVGAALTTAHAAVSAGDEVRAAAALKCAQALLFPHDPMGQLAVAAAARGGYEVGEAAVLSQDAGEVERRVMEEVDALESGYARVAAQVMAAALGAYSWKELTGGMGVGADVAGSQAGMFVLGLAKWAYLVEAAIDGLKVDDWVRVGAAVVAARRVTSSGG